LPLLSCCRDSRVPRSSARSSPPPKDSNAMVTGPFGLAPELHFQAFFSNPSLSPPLNPHQGVSSGLGIVSFPPLMVSFYFFAFFCHLLRACPFRVPSPLSVQGPFLAGPRPTFWPFPVLIFFASLFAETPFSTLRFPLSRPLASFAPGLGFTNTMAYRPEVFLSFFFPCFVRFSALSCVGDFFFSEFLKA